ncbi:major facilitator superfamily protein [Stylonychia lemnae]|uniref:Major facilitator superfamily protein n=1 Tax=Stylonychia lemnae TaxID=5949 RepID=A0A078AGP8_STYLE|nr:major facilitator superfamily protein [Stylonychia lemnae]|eukprot:CDW80707.1 major facilitator superfamily protein [Stylonychia lemnae]
MKEEYRRNLCQATHCSINFLILFIAFNSAQNIQSEALQQDNFGQLGFQSIAILYLGVAVGCVFSTVVMKRIGEVQCMALGAILNVPWILSYALCGISKDTNPDDRKFYLQPSFITGLIITLSFINGLGQAIQWVGQGKYLSDCATESTKGFFFSFFWSFYMASQIFGNLIGAFCIELMPQQIFFVVLSGISFISFFFCLFLRKPVSDASPLDELESPPISERHFSSDLTMASLTETIQPYSPIPQRNTEIKQQSIITDIVSIWNMAKTRRMRLFLLQQFWTGVSIAYYSGTLTPLISATLPNDSDSDKLSKSMLAMVAFGVGEVVGGLLIGYLIDTKGSKFVVIANVVIMILMVFFTIFYSVAFTYSPLAFVMTFLWGVQDGGVNTHCFEMLGFEFANNYEPYSIFNLLQALGASIFLIVASFVNDQSTFIGYSSAIGAFGILSCGITYFFRFRETQEDKKKKKKMKRLQQQQKAMSVSTNGDYNRLLSEDMNNINRTEILDHKLSSDASSRMKFIELNEADSSQLIASSNE